MTEKLIDRGDHYEIENCEVKEVICNDGTIGYCYCPYIPKILPQDEDLPCHT